MTITETAAVLSAGAICWRMHGGKPRVLLIRQSGRRDMSFPKGKVERGESLPEAAVRETREETGLSISLGAPLGRSEYTLPNGRDKVVHYWAAEVDDAVAAATRFTSNDEIEHAEWMSVKAARSELAFAPDRAVLDEFAQRAERDTLRTFAIVVLRHGKAVPGSAWNGPDSTRPLEQVGLEQARASARAIVAFDPRKLISSTAARCISTIEPVGSITGLDIKATAAISQDAYEDGTADIGKVITKRLAKKETTVLCSHGPVLPDILHEIAGEAHATLGRMQQAARLDVGEFSVVHLSKASPADGVVAVETHSPHLLDGATIRR